MFVSGSGICISWQLFICHFNTKAATVAPLTKSKQSLKSRYTDQIVIENFILMAMKISLNVPKSMQMLFARFRLRNENEGSLVVK